MKTEMGTFLFRTVVLQHIIRSMAILRSRVFRQSGAVPLLIINDTLARSLEPVVTECKEHTVHTQTQIVASRKPKEIKHTHESEANFTT